MPERIYFGTIKEGIEPPNLIEVQLNSYVDFLQKDVPFSKRRNYGLQAVFREVFPIESYDEKAVLDFSHYDIGEPKLSALEAQREGQTYSAPLHVTFQLREEKGTKEEKVYMGEIPLMTAQGTFVINGAERVVVSQLHRSPGIAFESSVHLNGKVLYSFRIIPDRGSWIEVQFDTADLLYIYLDRRKRRRKFLATTFLRALGYGSDEEVIKLFYTIETLKLSEKLGEEELATKVLIADVLDGEATVARAFEPLTAAPVRQIMALRHSDVKVIDISNDDTVVKALKKDPAHDQEEALKDIYRKLRPGDPPTVANAKALLKRLFFDPKKYDLGRVGRYKINQKLGINVDLSERIVTDKDFIGAIKYLISLRRGEGTLDDIDHLGSRRVRTVGELLANQCRVGLARTERLVKERMTLFDINIDGMTPQKLINPKALSAVIRDFFGRSQLSQFMDQTNPLAELTHKRRLSALGPGGLSRDRAGFEVRDVHHSHYGRICPVETPEGPNIGLIGTMSTFARVNEMGFLETPYRKVEKGRVSDQVDYLTGDREENFLVAQANAPMDAKGHFTGEKVSVRYRGDFLEVEPSKVHYMDVSPKQLVSVAAGLIPFLEHDDANRAPMGSKIPQQGGSLIVSEAPLVGTGLEGKVARDSHAVLIATESGKVASVTADQIVVTKDGHMPEARKKLKTDAEAGIHVYELRKFMRSNAGTCVNQKPIVHKGQHVKKGQVIADGPNTDQGELALGRNVLVAFMPWNGYNFEDAIMISEKVVKEDIYTSIHIDEFEIGARDTKLGPEEITRDIPNVSEEALKNLDEAGIVYIGAEVRAGDILVGKITPKGESPMTPEEKLLRAIFGEKASDVRDTSLRAPPGVQGTIVEVRVFNRHGVDKDERALAIEREEIERLAKDRDDEQAILDRNVYGRLAQTLGGRRALARAEGFKKDSKITKAVLDEYPRSQWWLFASPNDKLMAEIEAIRKQYDESKKGLEQRFLDKVEKLQRGDELPPGVMKMVKVFVAVKRKIQPGDKMAGRHGNKGVVSKIVPVEDMPFLEDGTHADIVLNPLGVPSRMNVGQILETHLGWACAGLGKRIGQTVDAYLASAKQDTRPLKETLKKIYGDDETIKSLNDSELMELGGNLRHGVPIATPVFDGAKEADIEEMLKLAGLDASGQSTVYDGRTGDAFDRKVTVGYIYMLKLHHLVDDKIHARSIGPYSLVTQQPLGGKAQFGGQRFGEMEVWALEAYGAAYTLQEMLTLKSDDVAGRTKVYESIVRGDDAFESGIPESFNVLVKEMRSLCLNVELNQTTKPKNQLPPAAAAE